jgi:hypothetical protein
MRDMLKNTLAAFDEHAPLWTAVSGCLAEVDCLLSFLTVKSSMGQPMCKPQFVDDRVVLDVTGLRHPCIVSSGYCEEIKRDIKKKKRKKRKDEENSQRKWGPCLQTRRKGCGIGGKSDSDD